MINLHDKLAMLEVQRDEAIARLAAMQQPNRDPSNPYDYRRALEDLADYEDEVVSARLLIADNADCPADWERLLTRRDVVAALP